MKTKIIEFYPHSEVTDLTSNNPYAAKSCVPEWYKKIPIFTDGDKSLNYPLDWVGVNHTIKKCVPFLDAMTSGYMVCLDEDVFVKQTDAAGPLFRWKSKDILVDFHSTNQFEGVPIPEVYARMIGKWHSSWEIRTPPGYSLLFTHPLNRFELPFQTLTGIVDCDKYVIPVQFPFYLKKDFEGIIEAGTPLVQLIPIKREKWESKKHRFSRKRNTVNHKQFWKTFVDSYRKNFWEKKQYN